jgi:hypothetical protein
MHADPEQHGVSAPQALPEPMHTASQYTAGAQTFVVPSSSGAQHPLSQSVSFKQVERQMLAPGSVVS